MSEATENIRRQSGNIQQWAGVLAGPVAWFLHLQLSYSFVQTACETRQKWPLHLITLGALLLVAIGAALAWRVRNRLPEGSTEEGSPQETRGRFMALMGLMTSALFALIILTAEISNWVLRACD